LIPGVSEGRALVCVYPMLDLLLKETFVRSLFGWLALLTPAASLVACGAAKIMRGKAPKGAEAEERARNCPRSRRTGWWVFGLTGPLLWLLWQVYEAIMNATGFASVRGLLIVLTLFLVLGLVLGWFLGRWTQEQKFPSNAMKEKKERR
jgi:hypothetical protein